MAQNDVLVSSCMTYLNDNADKYFAMVSEKDDDGILWAVFICDPTRSGNTAVDVKRASFLPLSQVMSTKAQSLIQMYNACNLASQFVCWFTLENLQGEPLVSKVMVVDAPSARRGGSSQPKPLANAMSAMKSGTSNETVLENLKADMMSFQEQEGGPRSLSSTQQSIRRDSTPSMQRTPNRARGNSEMRSAAESAHQYQHILRVSLQIADSVSRMGTAMDELTQRVTKLEHELETRPKPPPPELMAKLLARVEELEKRNTVLEQRAATFDTFQENIFTQFQQFKDQFKIPTFASTQNTPALSTSVTAGSTSALGRSVLDTPPRSKSPPAAAARHADPAPVATSYQTSKLDVSSMSAAAAHHGTATPSSGGGLFSANMTTTSPPQRSASSSNGAGSGDSGASLSEMIKNMEMKLTRIRAPSN